MWAFLLLSAVPRHESNAEIFKAAPRSATREPARRRERERKRDREKRGGGRPGEEGSVTGVVCCPMSGDGECEWAMPVPAMPQQQGWHSCKRGESLRPVCKARPPGVQRSCRPWPQWAAARSPSRGDAGCRCTGAVVPGTQCSALTERGEAWCDGGAASGSVALPGAGAPAGQAGGTAGLRGALPILQFAGAMEAGHGWLGTTQPFVTIRGMTNGLSSIWGGCRSATPALSLPLTPVRIPRRRPLATHSRFH